MRNNITGLIDLLNIKFSTKEQNKWFYKKPRIVNSSQNFTAQKKSFLKILTNLKFLPFLTSRKLTDSNPFVIYSFSFIVLVA
ncbi:hypothetical protein BpHYR1_054097 [Brachionus plicatilis]|uniref:Uncharacterized protein n=1 Tax=Brachionus plicatilis TaxID=10195 RepID=A0A3M7RXF6_BRAPC|nr:hypothetical protein BpHYR1_054097 [Brachionus plicatilis]